MDRRRLAAVFLMLAGALIAAEEFLGDTMAIAGGVCLLVAGALTFT